jgi:Iron-dependent Transcriptional regulator
VRVSAKVDYAVRAGVALAAAQERDDARRPVKAEALARAQEIPLKFLENILQGLRQAGIVESRRGPEGGTGWPGRRPRARSPTSSARSTARWPCAGGRAPGRA